MLFADGSHSTLPSADSQSQPPLLIQTDPQLIRSIAGRFPALVAIDPLQSNNTNWRWDWISAALVLTAPVGLDWEHESLRSFLVLDKYECDLILSYNFQTQVAITCVLLIQYFTCPSLSCVFLNCTVSASSVTFLSLVVFSPKEKVKHVVINLHPWNCARENNSHVCKFLTEASVLHWGELWQLYAMLILFLDLDFSNSEEWQLWNFP